MKQKQFDVLAKDDFVLRHNTRNDECHVFQVTDIIIGKHVKTLRTIKLMQITDNDEREKRITITGKNVTSKIDVIIRDNYEYFSNPIMALKRFRKTAENKFKKLRTLTKIVK